MGYTYDKELIDWIEGFEAWRQWARQKPSFLKHPIQYLKWYFSEPNFDKWIKENKK